MRDKTSPKSTKYNTVQMQNSENLSEEDKANVLNTSGSENQAFHGILQRMPDLKITGTLESHLESMTFSKSRNGINSTKACPDTYSNPTVNEENPMSGRYRLGDSGSLLEEVEPPGDAKCSQITFLPSCVPPGSSKREWPQERNSGTLGEVKEEEHKSDFGNGYVNSTLSPAELSGGNNNLLQDTGCVKGITESEKHQFEMFFKSLKSQVFVCESLVNLYVGWKEDENKWKYKHTGVIVVILDCGDTKSRNKRKIQILLAERGTCFPLWKDTIDNLSSYRKSSTAFHTMYLSSDHRQMAGFSFDSSSEADKLLSHVERLTSDPENINISIPSSKRKSKDSLKKRCDPLPHKKQISKPCLFQHVISVAAGDKPVYMSLQSLLNNDILKSGTK